MDKSHLSPIYMLDKVLEWFAMDAHEMGMGEQLTSREKISKKEAHRLIVDKFSELNHNDFLLYYNLIIEKLVKDNYLTFHESHELLYSDHLYSITFEGKLFSQSGGYARKIKKESTQATLQSSQTWAIVIGTLGAGIYGLLEVWKSICK